MPDHINPRTALLARAIKIVNGERNADYGSPADNLAHTAALWSAQFEDSTTSTDVAIAMILVKLSRLSTSPGHEDSWTDIAGWAAIGWECAITGEDSDPSDEEAETDTVLITELRPSGILEHPSWQQHG